MYPLRMASIKQRTLCWYAKTESNWKYFPAIIETAHGMKQARDGWVMDKGQLVHYPTGRYVIRSYSEGRKVYQPVESSNPRDAVIPLQRAQRAALGVDTRNPLIYLKPPPPPSTTNSAPPKKPHSPIT